MRKKPIFYEWQWAEAFLLTDASCAHPRFDGKEDWSLVSRSTLGKCSLLHSQQCAIDDWTAVLQVRGLRVWESKLADCRCDCWELRQRENESLKPRHQSLFL
jgi:hypothetical protein